MALQSSNHALFIGGSASVKYSVQPLVMFAILDQFMRRDEGNTRVIGALLGTRPSDSVVEIRNSFAIVFSEDDQSVFIHPEEIKSMIELNQRINPREEVVGWYVTDKSIDTKILDLHNHFKSINPNSVLMLLDTSLSSGSINMRGFVSQAVVVAEQSVGSQFVEVATEVRTPDLDKIGMDVFMKSRVSSSSPSSSSRGISEAASDLDNLEASIRKLHSLLETVSAHVDRVVKGEVEGDKKLGRFLMDAINSVPLLSAETLDSMFNGTMQDMMMVVYLSNLTKSQLLIAERLQNAM